MLRCIVVDADPAVLEFFFPSHQLAISTQEPRTGSWTRMIAIRSVIQRLLQGDQSQSRDAKELLNILRSLERVVHLFLNEGSSRGATHRQNQSYGEIDKAPRLARPCGWLLQVGKPV